ncbi:MAG: hypothetical protein AABX55_00470 [Nanoarchaeota archaeon]
MFRKTLKRYFEKRYFDNQISFPKEVNKIEFYICENSSHYGLDGNFILEITKNNDSPSILEALIQTFNSIRNGCKALPDLYFGKEPRVLLRPKTDKDAIILFIETEKEYIDRIGFALRNVHIALRHYKQNIESKL